MTFLICVILIAVTLIWRRFRLRALERWSMQWRSLGPDGIVCGGEGFVLANTGPRAVLLLHGAGDTPQTLRYLADALHARGYHVSAPLLPRHGRRLADFARLTADELTRAARTSYNELKITHDWVALIGLSMGGALAVQIAAETPDLPVLGLVAPYLAMPRRADRAARWAWLWGLVVPAVRSAEGLSIRDPVERARGLAYGVITPAALRALRTTVQRAVRALPRVTAPTLVVQSREDNRISVHDAERAFLCLGAREKRLDWITGAAHIITVDYGRDQVIASLVRWLDEHANS